MSIAILMIQLQGYLLHILRNYFSEKIMAITGISMRNLVDPGKFS